MTKSFWIGLVVVIIALVSIFYFTGSKNTANTNLKTTNHVEGLGKDGVKLVEYGDFECPFCGQYYPVIKQVEATYNDQITFQFINFPLTSIHHNAFAGARAAEAAGLMGKYWQMHDLLYQENQVYYNNGQQGTWIGPNDPLPVFDQYASSLGLNVSRFNTLYNSDQVNNLVQADLNKATNLGLQGTPTFYLDGTQISPGVFNAQEILNDPATIANFEKDINKEITKKGFTPPAGTVSGSATNSTGGQSVK